MLLRLIRSQYAPTGTVGRLYVDGQSFCDTLEPPYGSHSGSSALAATPSPTPSATPSASPTPSRAEAKKTDPKHTKGCIPLGFYKVAITMSPRFRRPLPLLYYVPGFEGIRIHPGSEPKHTAGCILVGEAVKAPFIASSGLMGSRKTSDTLNSLILKAQKDHEDIFISIEEQDAYPLADSVCPPELRQHYLDAQRAIQIYYDRHPNERPTA